MGTFGEAEQKIRRQTNDKLQRNHRLQIQSLQRKAETTELVIRRHKTEKHLYQRKKQ